MAGLDPKMLMERGALVLYQELLDQAEMIRRAYPHVTGMRGRVVMPPRQAKTATPKATGGKRTMSPEARARISEAQKKRWRKAKGNAPHPPAEITLPLQTVQQQEEEQASAFSVPSHEETTAAVAEAVAPRKRSRGKTAKIGKKKK